MIWLGFLEAMRVQHSNFEWDVLKEMNRRGYFPEQDKYFCLLVTIPDGWFSTYGVAYYLDHKKVHEKRRERDVELRFLLKKRHPYVKEVVEYTYARRSRWAMLEAADKIEEAIKGWIA